MPKLYFYYTYASEAKEKKHYRRKSKAYDGGKYTNPWISIKKTFDIDIVCILFRVNI